MTSTSSDLPRVLEPEVMDSVDEAIAYDQMDHAAVNQLFAKDFLATGYAADTDAEAGDGLGEGDTEGLAGECIDLGTGTAQIPIEICRQSPTARVLAVDLSISMLDLARNNIEVAGLMHRIQLDHIDAKGIGYEDERFSAVISNSIVHHIPKPSAVFAEAARLAAPGGILFFRDLARPKTEELLEQLVTTYAGEESADSQKMFRESLHAALTVDEVQAMITELGFASDSVKMTSDRHWTWFAKK